MTSQQPSEHSCPHILVVDDRPENIITLQHILEDVDAVVVGCTSGSEALRHMLTTPFALVLLDVQMPDMDGYEVAELMRMKKSTRLIPIIFITAGYHEEAAIFKGYEHGAVDYMLKPINHCILLAKVQVFCDLFSAQQLLRAEIENGKRLQKERDHLSGSLRRAARKSGMAEVATNVLHNIGNVLTSATISTQFCQESMAHSPLKNLAQIHQLLDDHSDDMPAFLQSEKALVLPAMIDHVFQSYTSDHKQIVAELDGISVGLRHIAAITAAQQDHSRAGDIYESTRLDELLARCLLMLKSNLNCIDIKIHSTGTQNLYTVPHRIEQVIINLLSNACNALSHAQQPQIQIRSSWEESTCVITIDDNGCGIHADSIRSIFAHGVTSHADGKEHGHGLGLHDCLLTMTAINGSISASSAGVGHGACFTLRIDPPAAEHISADHT